MPPVTNRNAMDALALISTTLSLTERLNRLNDFLKEKLAEQLKPLEPMVLIKFNQVFQQIHADFISQAFDENAINSVSAYFKFWQTLFKADYRYLVAKNEIKIEARNFQEAALFVVRKATAINETFVEDFSSALKLSFDVPKFLKEYKLFSTLTTELAERCFLEKDLNVHSVTTRFFHLLGYQGQLLFYYKDDSKFNISNVFLNAANEYLVDEAIDLQHNFLNASQQRNISRPLLKHYFYTSFLKTIYKAEPSYLDTSSSDRRLSYYFDKNYNPLPRQFACDAYLPQDYKVTIEYSVLPERIPKMACQAIACSREEYKKWKTSLEKASPRPLDKLKSHYIYRVSDSYEAYQEVPFAYGHSPLGGGFYILGDVKNNTVHGVGYSYWGGNEHNFISTARHEAIHHDNYHTYIEFSKVNPKISNFLNRNWNEGLAVEFADGACSKGYVSQNTSGLAALDLQVLLGNKYIGYHPSWIINNYFINHYPNFHADLLTLNKVDFIARWEKRISADTGFPIWLKRLNETCQRYGLRDLSIEQCPSVYLQDYRPISATAVPDIKTSTASRARILVPTRSPNQLPKPVFYQDYRQLMHAIQDKDTMTINEIGKKPRYLAIAIFNYRDPARKGQTPLHFALYAGDCSPDVISSLVANGANPRFCNQAGVTSYQEAQQNCKNWSEIKSIFDRFAQRNNFTTPPIATTSRPIENSTLVATTSLPSENSTTITTEDVIDEVSAWEPLTHATALAVGFGNGVLAGVVDIGIDEGQKRKYLNNLGAQVLHYGLTPAIATLVNLSYTLSAMGPATVIGAEGTLESALFYAALDYMGAVAGKVISQLVLSRLPYFFFFLIWVYFSVKEFNYVRCRRLLTAC